MVKNVSRLLMFFGLVLMAYIYIICLVNTQASILLFSFALVFLSSFIIFKWRDRNLKKSSIKKDITERKYTTLFYISLLIYFILQLIVGSMIVVHPSWDFEAIYRESTNLVLKGYLETDYLNTYPHNAFLTSICVGYYKLITTLGLSPNVYSILLLNIVFIDVFVVIFYFCVKQAYSAKSALFLTIALYFFLPLLAYSPILYSDTASLPFVVFPIYIELRKKDDVTRRNTILLTCLQGVTLGLGYLVKGSVFIIFLALIIATIIYGKFKLAKIISLMISFMFCVFLLNQAFYASGLVDPNSSKTFPKTHWVMMGLTGTGSFNQKVVDFSRSFPDVKTREEANIEIIKQRIEEHGPVGLIKHLNGKIKFTWTDGSYYSDNKLNRNPIKDNWAVQCFNPESVNHTIYLFLCNTYHTVIMFGIMLSFFSIVANPLSEKYLPFLCNLSICGIALFLLIWETRSRYLLSFFPLFLISSYSGYKWVILKFLHTNKKAHPR